jgi:hypothetical protein
LSQRNEKKEGEIFMSLDNIQLSYETCSVLFNTHLIRDAKSDIEKNSPEKIQIDCLGENQQKALFIVNEPAYKFLPDEEMELLTKLVSACKLSLADIALVNFSSNKCSYHQLNEQFHPEKILIFGVINAELGLPFDIPAFQVQKFQQQLYLTAPSLTEFISNTSLKKELWAALQKIFF